MQQHKKIAILGFGKEGRSALRFLKKSPDYKNAAVNFLDQKFDAHYLNRLSDYDLIIKSPGVPWHLPEITKALKSGVTFSTPTALFFSASEGHSCRHNGHERQRYDGHPALPNAKSA